MKAYKKAKAEHDKTVQEYSIFGELWHETLPRLEGKQPWTREHQRQLLWTVLEGNWPVIPDPDSLAECLTTINEREIQPVNKRRIQVVALLVCC